VEDNELLRWRARHEGHDVVPHELVTGGDVTLPEIGRMILPRHIKRGLMCETCTEVIWLDEVRPDEPIT